MNYMPVVRTVPTPEAYKKLWWSSFNPYFSLAIWTVLTLLYAKLAVRRYLLYISDRISSPVSYVALFFIGINIYYIVNTFRKPKKMYEQTMAVSPDRTETYYFGDIGFTHESNGVNIMEHNEIPYTRISSAKFSSGWFFLTVDRNRHIVFSSSEITEGNADQLIELLRIKLVSRFKVKM